MSLSRHPKEHSTTKRYGDGSKLTDTDKVLVNDKTLKNDLVHNIADKHQKATKLFLKTSSLKLTIEIGMYVTR